MKLVIGGCRGAYPVVHQRFSTYGGDTTSFLVLGASGDRILLDLGTGARLLGERLREEPGTRALLVLLTHYHLDHLAGLPSLLLLHDPTWSVTFAAPPRQGQRVRSVLGRLLKPPFSPLQMEDHAAAMAFRTLHGQTSTRALRWGALRVRWCPLQHPGGCTAYRIEEGDRALVVATDVEWALSTPEQRHALHTLCATPRPADLLVMDGQYSQESYPGHEGWGHSTWQECVAIAQNSGVKRLVVTHHAPVDDDPFLEQKAAKIRGVWPQAHLAQAGDVYEFPDPTAPTPPAPARP